MKDTLKNIIKMKREKAKLGARKRAPGRLVSTWVERDILNSNEVNAFVAILNTTGCQWARDSGCSMCGYYNDTNQNVKEGDILEQLEIMKKRYNGQPYIKIFMSGSFLNPSEISTESAQKFLKYFSEKCEKLCIETRPEHLTPWWVGQLAQLPCVVEVAMGLESSNETVRNVYINKNMSFDQYRERAELSRDNGIEIKTYLLLKPPFLTERQAVEDCIRSVFDTIPFSNSISINPVNIQKFTLVEYLNYRGNYRTPWYYSLEEVFRRCLPVAQKNNVRLMSSPSGEGTFRGIHNCNNCNKKYSAAIKSISLNKTGIEVFDKIECACKVQWQCDLTCQETAVDGVSVG